MSAALVSVIMPCYNDGRYIKEAIDSLRRQTYSNFELIIVDDGSDDSETVSILSTLNDGKTTVLHTNHLRPAGARNYGIERARGKYILPLDSDDTIEPTYLEKAVNVLETQPDIGVVYCQADLFGEKSGRWELPDYSRRAMLLDNIVFVTSMFYRSDWETVGGFKTSFQESCPQVQQIYRRIFENHKDFYKNNYDEVIPIMRDALIEQIFLRKKLETELKMVQGVKNIPILGKFIKWIIEHN